MFVWLEGKETTQLPCGCFGSLGVNRVFLNKPVPAGSLAVCPRSDKERVHTSIKQSAASALLIIAQINEGRELVSVQRLCVVTNQGISANRDDAAAPSPGMTGGHELKTNWRIGDNIILTWNWLFATMIQVLFALIHEDYNRSLNVWIIRQHLILYFQWSPKNQTSHTDRTNPHILNLKFELIL